MDRATSLLTSTVSWIGTASWQASLLVIAIALLQFTLGKRLSARWRHALWLLVLARLFLPSLPETGLIVRHWLPSPPATLALPFNPPSPPRPVFPATIPQARHPLLPPRSGAPSAIATPTAAPLLPRLLPALWLTGFLLTLAIGGIGYRRHRRRLLRHRQPLSPTLATAFRNAQTRLGTHRGDCICSEAITSPMICGLWKPIIALPCDLEQKLPPRDLEIILLHEVAHLKRGDLWLAWLAGLATALHWFNPIIWLAMAQARKDREMACDQWLIERTGNPEAYGSALVRFIESSQVPKPFPGSIGIFESRSFLFARLGRIIGYRKPTRLGTALGIALVLLLGTLFLTRAADQKTNTFPLSAQEKLMEAIKANDLKAAKKTLAQGADIKETDLRPLVGFLPPMAEAIRHSDLAMVKLLIEHGALPYRKQEDGKVDLYARQAYFLGHTAMGNYLNGQPGGAVEPLIHAAANGDQETFQRLLPKANRDTQLDAPRIAAAANQIAILKLLPPDPTIQKRLFSTAAGAGALGTINYLLKSGISLDEVGADALRHAARENRTEVISFLLKNGISPDAGTGDHSPLFSAMISGATQAATQLIEAGASVNQQNEQGMSPLSWAVNQNQVELVRLLLEHGADWNLPDQHGTTPLLFSASAHSPESLALFLERGGDINTIHPRLGTMLSLAQRMIGEDSGLPTLFPFQSLPQSAYQRMLDTVCLILDREPRLIDEPDRDGLTPLAAAITRGQTAIFNELLTRGAKINTRDASGNTPLLHTIHPAISIPSQTAMIDRLLANGADPNLGLDFPLKPGGLPSPLKTAIAHQSFPRLADTYPVDRQALVNQLLRHGARFATPEASATEAMLLAATTGDLAALHRELARGTSPNVADDRGWTPLMSAFGMGHHAVATALLKAGADVKAHDASGLTPLWLAITGYAPRAVIEQLLDLGANPNASHSNPFGTPLSMAIMVRDDPAMAELLLQRGADPNRAGISGNDEEPLLTWILIPRHAHFVPLLLRYGANPNRPGFEGKTPLHLAIEEKLPRAVSQLLEAGADPLQVDSYQQSILEAARQSGNPAILNLITKAITNPMTPSAPKSQ